jgi:hypothetical protein
MSLDTIWTNILYFSKIFLNFAFCFGIDIYLTTIMIMLTIIINRVKNINWTWINLLVDLGYKN